MRGPKTYVLAHVGRNGRSVGQATIVAANETEAREAFYARCPERRITASGRGHLVHLKGT